MNSHPSPRSSSNLMLLSTKGIPFDGDVPWRPFSAATSRDLDRGAPFQGLGLRDVGRCIPHRRSDRDQPAIEIALLRGATKEKEWEGNVGDDRRKPSEKERSRK